MTHFIAAARTPAALLLGILLMLAGSPLLGQTLPTQTPTTDQTRLSPEEVARFQKKKALGEYTERIRKALVGGDYDTVIKEVDEARKVDPNSPVLTLYRKMAEEKKLGVPIGKALRTPRGMTPTVAAATSGGLEAAALHTPAPTAVPSETPAAKSTPASASRNAPEVTAAPARKPHLYAAIGAVALLALTFAAYKKFAARKNGEQEEEDEQEEQEEVQVFEPKGLSMSALALSNAEHAPMNPEDIAANIADSIGALPSSTAVPPPTFDFAHLHGEGLESENHDLPTTLDVPDHEEPEHEVESENIVLPPDLDARIPLTESTPQVPAAPPKPVVPAAPKAVSSDSVSFEDLGISFASDDDEPPPPPKPAPGKAEQATSEAYKYAPEVVEAPTAAPQPASSPDAIVLTGMSEPEAPKAEPSKTPLGAINLGDVFSAASGSPAKTPPPEAPRQKAPEPTSMQLDTVSFAVPSLDEPDDTKSQAVQTPAPIQEQEDSISLGDTITLDFLSETKTSYSGTPSVTPPPPPPPATPAAKPVEEREQSPTASMPNVAPSFPSAATADERSERMFMEQRAHGLQAFDQKNWKQAVHYLSIAAAIHPEDDELRVRLREAREQKRREEAGS